MWYMYSLFGAMLFLPVLKLMVKHFSEAENKFILVVGFLFLCVIPMIEFWIGKNFYIEFPMNCVYCYYMLIGYWIDKGWLRIKTWIASTGAVISVILLILEAWLRVEYNRDIALSANFSPIMFLWAFCIYNIMLNRIGNDKEYKPATERIIEFLSKHSFGVYIVHMFWINVLYKLIKFNPFTHNAVLSMLGLWVVTVVASVVTTMILKRIPLVKKIV